LPSLVAVLQHDAPFDTEIAKAALETLMQLCEVAEKVSSLLGNLKLLLMTFSPPKTTLAYGTWTTSLM